jgi:SAM-dependent methyltransferase
MHSTNPAVPVDYTTRWQAALAPRTGDIRRELTMEAAEYLGISFDEAAQRVESSGNDFLNEWLVGVSDPADPDQVTKFYNESQAELFEQIAWHSSEQIHHRSLVCADLVSSRPGRDFLDFGSGIGSNALVFGLAGFRVAIADIADPLRNFAKWRLERRGIAVRALDLKRESIEKERYDVITCFDVLEHVPDPVDAVKRMRDALRPGGTYFLYAPFGPDPERPQHIVHEDPVTERMRSFGFAIEHEWENAFPPYVNPPSVFTRVSRSPLTDAAYYVRDVWLNGPVTDSLVRSARALKGVAGGR